jgi:hypothetical protein
MSDINLESLEQKLDVLIRLNAYIATRDMTVAEAAPLLNGLGMSPAEIAFQRQKLKRRMGRLRLISRRKNGFVKKI